MADFLRSKYHLVLFHGRNSTQITLYESGIVIVNIIPNAKLVFQLRDSDLCLLKLCPWLLLILAFTVAVFQSGLPQLFVFQRLCAGSVLYFLSTLIYSALFCRCAIAAAM